VSGDLCTVLPARRSVIQKAARGVLVLNAVQTAPSSCDLATSAPNGFRLVCCGRLVTEPPVGEHCPAPGALMDTALESAGADRIDEEPAEIRLCREFVGPILDCCTHVALRAAELDCQFVDHHGVIGELLH